MADAKGASQARKIPFFGIGIAPFPGEALPLHLFEPRYLKMLEYTLGEGLRASNCASHEYPHFGMAFVAPSKSGMKDSTVGTVLRIMEPIEFLEGGRALIVCEGVSRFEIVRREDFDDFPGAIVTPYEDREMSADRKAALSDMVLSCKDHLASYLSAVDSGVALNEVALTAYQMAALAQLSIEERLTLLPMRDELERLEYVGSCLKFKVVEANAADSGETDRLIH